MADFTYEVGGWGLRIRFGSDAYASYNIYSPHILYNSSIFECLSLPHESVQKR